MSEADFRQNAKKSAPSALFVGGCVISIAKPYFSQISAGSSYPLLHGVSLEITLENVNANKMNDTFINSSK